MYKLSKHTQVIVLFGLIIASVYFGYIFNQNANSSEHYKATFLTKDVSQALYPQHVIATLSTPVEITKIYHEEKLIGILNDAEYFQTLLDNVYVSQYETEFPDSKLGYIQDVYLVQEFSYNQYENIDDQLFQYIYDSDLLAVEVNRISFSNGAVIYVKNADDFSSARKEFILGYISEETYTLLANNQRISALSTYGTQEIGFDVLETITVSKGMATIDEIYLNETDILNFLSFGYNPKVEVYTVQDFDTIEGIAWLNEMSPNQLVSINKNILSDTNQVIKPGVRLNVAKFNSPLTVRVTKQRMTSESIYPEATIYREDPDLREGLTRVEQKEVIGSEDVLYEDVYENDVAVSSRRVSSNVTKEPIQEIVYVGTYEEPKVGSGSLSWPMVNARVSCGWYCYGGHSAVDIQSRSNRGYGPIYAADRGVVVLNQYYYGYGYYIVIDHNNGMKTAYGHMESLGYFPVGSTVRRGDQIGYVGMSGITTGPHVHFEVFVNGSKVNPCHYIGC